MWSNTEKQLSDTALLFQVPLFTLLPSCLVLGVSSSAQCSVWSALSSYTMRLLWAQCIHMYILFPTFELSVLLSAQTEPQPLFAFQPCPFPRSKATWAAAEWKRRQIVLKFDPPPSIPAHLLFDLPINLTFNELNWNEFYRNENAMNHHQDPRHVAGITTHTTEECGVRWLIWPQPAGLRQFVTHSCHRIPS